VKRLRLWSAGDRNPTRRIEDRNAYEVREEVRLIAGDSLQDREPHRQEAGAILWFTGLSGAGKTTLCDALAQRLRARGAVVEVLDADELRRTLSEAVAQLQTLLQRDLSAWLQ